MLSEEAAGFVYRRSSQVPTIALPSGWAGPEWCGLSPRASSGALLMPLQTQERVGVALRGQEGWGGAGGWCLRGSPAQRITLCSTPHFWGPQEVVSSFQILPPGSWPLWDLHEGQ